MSGRDLIAGAGGYGRPMSSAARMAAMKARFNPSSTNAMLSSLGAGGGTQEYNFAAFDNLLNAINGWFEGLDKLSDQSSARRKLSEEDGSEEQERVHKVPALGKQSQRDVVMDDAPQAPAVAEIKLESKNSEGGADDGCSADSVERIRPATPPNLFHSNEPTPEDEDHEMTTAAHPTSPPARRMEDLDIHTPPVGPVATSRAANPPTALTTPTSNPSSTPFLDPLERMRSPLTTATSNVTLPPTPHPIEPVPSADEKCFIAVKAENIDTQQPPVMSPPTPMSEANTVVSQSAKEPSVISSSASIKKRPKLSSRRTILDSLMEKKARNPIYYDGEAQKFFHDLVLEMSQQIQAVKKERRMVMFAKDPACSNALDKFDKTLQACLKIVETGSFKWLKGRPDWKEIKEMKDKLAQARKEAEDFKKSGWLPGGDDDSTEDDDDDESVDLEI